MLFAETRAVYLGICLPRRSQLSRELIRQYLDVCRAIYRKLPDFDYDGAEMRRSEELRKQI
jgi:hypothetical protein